MSAGYPTSREKKVVKAAESLMEQAMAKYDPSHDVHHVRRVRKTAISLALAYVDRGPDILVVELAALLHDVLDKKYVSVQEAPDPYAFFLPFFTNVSSHVNLIADGRARLVTRIVENVSWTTEKKLRETEQWTTWHDTCIELHCVQDADRLDAIGAFGIMRCAAFSAVSNRPLYVPGDTPQSKESAIQHFHDKLLKIKDCLKTQTGKRWGEKRHHLMLEFLHAVDQESGADTVSS